MALSLTDTSSSAQSPAFQAGLAHGKVLAQTHAAQGKSPTLTMSNGNIVERAPGKTPYIVKRAAGTAVAPASDATSQLLQLLTQNVGQTPAQLSTQASTLAKNDIASQVAALQQQQSLANNQAAQRAQQINLAAQAAARYEAGLGDQTAASFDNAAKAEAGFAQGYSGQLQQTASDAAAQVQAGLASVGAPAGQAPSTTQGMDLANVLYGLGGAIPASALETAGQAAAAAQRQLPAATLGYGQQQASGALGAGATQAATLTPQIANALAQQPTLAAQYLIQLGTQNNDAVSARNSQIELASLIQNRDATQTTDAAKAAKPSTFGSASTGYYSIDPTSGKVTQVTPPVVKPTTPKTFGSAKTGYYTIGTDGAVTQITKPAPDTAAQPKYSASVSRSLGYKADQFGNPIGGKISPLPGFKLNSAGTGAVKATSTKPLTTEQTLKFKGLSANFAATAANGGVDAKTGAAIPSLSYPDAITQAVKEGLPLNGPAGVIVQLNKVYVPGDKGRPLTPVTKQTKKFFASKSGITASGY